MRPSETTVLVLFGFAITGFVLMAIGFGRLFAQAWRSEDRKQQVWRVLNVQPRKNADWPHNTREADLIAMGALFGVVFFGGLLALVFWR